MDREQAVLAYLARSERPLWGGHLQRGEPLDESSDIRRWLTEGWIEQVGMDGYRITDAGRALLPMDVSESGGPALPPLNEPGQMVGERK